MKQNSKGISLITLVITIIVIIILAGAVILSLSSNNPIGSAKEATFKSDLANYRSQLTVYLSKQYANSQGQYNSKLLNATNTYATYNGSNIDGISTMKDILPSMKNEHLNMFEIQEGELVYVGTDEEETVWATEIDTIGSSPTHISYQKSVAVVQEGNVTAVNTDNATIDGKSPAYNNPIIPKGFAPVNTTSVKLDTAKANEVELASLDIADISLEYAATVTPIDVTWENVANDWNEGLVIEDLYGNQFVWVPVDGIDVKYEKWVDKWYPISSRIDDTFPDDFNELYQINKYGGFYIGRYEAAFDYNEGNIRASMKKSKYTSMLADWQNSRNAAHTGYLWNWINYNDAKQYAEDMDTAYGYDTSKIGTNLVTGTQYDTVMKWIQNAGYNVISDSRDYGNYSNAVSPANISGKGSLQISGYSEYWKAKNIYDIAGNMYIWTNEKDDSSNYIRRGGDYYCSGTSDTAAIVYKNINTYNDRAVGFSIALYIK